MRGRGRAILIARAAPQWREQKGEELDRNETHGGFHASFGRVTPAPNDKSAKC
jgi:hypothetical protein